LVDFIEKNLNLEKKVKRVWRSFWKGQSCGVV
jgi:hypothetical protein